MIKTEDHKRYFWLKMKEDFFSSKRIKKLRKMAGGDTYTIIYLKMQLLSLKTDGVLTWTGLEDDFATELALDLDEEPDDVHVVLMYLLSCGLIETSDNVNFFLPYVAENTGSENASAQRVRDYRARKALQCNTDVTQMKRIGNAEKEIDKEKEIRVKSKNIYEEFAAGNPDLLDALKEYDSYRKMRKKPLTDDAKKRLINRLKKFKQEEWIQILNQSIDRGWTDIYELKTDFAKPKKVTPGMGTVEERQKAHEFKPTEF